MNAKPKVLLIIGGALVVSALVVLLIAEQTGSAGGVKLVLRLCAAVDGVLGLGALFLGLRKLGEEGRL